jgi:hypothetical protein
LEQVLQVEHLAALQQFVVLTVQFQQQDLQPLSQQVAAVEVQTKQAHL